MPHLSHTATFITYDDAGDELGTLTLEMWFAYQPARPARGYGASHNPGVAADYGLCSTRVVGTGLHRSSGCTGPDADAIAALWLKHGGNRQVIADQVEAASCEFEDVAASEAGWQRGLRAVTV